MKENEFLQNVTTLVNILQESDIVTRSIELSKRGKREVNEQAYSTKVSYDYFFTSSNKQHVIYIKKRDVGCYGEHEEVVVKYNGKKVLEAVECFSENVPQLQVLIKDKPIEYSSNGTEIYLFVKKPKNNEYYKIIHYKQGEWEGIIYQIENGTIEEFKEPEKSKEEPEINPEYVKILNENFKI